MSEAPTPSTDKLTPTYYGYVGSTKDALLIIQAALDKQLELVPRRPHERERSTLIKSGNVFVFVEEHSGVKRWTDGITWSPSRILGRFLIYRELDKHSLGEKDEKKKKKRKRSLNMASDESSSESTSQSTSMNNVNSIHSQPDLADGDVNKHLVGSLATSYVFKDQGLIKKTLSLTALSKEPSDEKDEKQTIHLISYYNVHDVLNGKLLRPPDTKLKNLNITNNLWNAVKESLLGGKIPIEDEAYYFLDKNYQLQNMSLLQQPNLPPPPQLQSHPQPQPHQQYMAPKNSNSSSSNNSLHMLPTPLQHTLSAPHIPTNQLRQTRPPNQYPTNKDEYSYSSNAPHSNDFLFVNPFSSTSGPSNTSYQTQPPPLGTTGNTVPPPYGNYILPQQQYSNVQHQMFDNHQSNYPSNYPMYPHFQQMGPPRLHSQSQYFQQQPGAHLRNSIGTEFPVGSKRFSSGGSNFVPLQKQYKSNSTPTSNIGSNSFSLNSSGAPSTNSSINSGWFTTASQPGTNVGYTQPPHRALSQDLPETNINLPHNPNNINNDNPINMTNNQSNNNTDNRNQPYIAGSNFTSS